MQHITSDSPSSPESSQDTPHTSRPTEVCVCCHEEKTVPGHSFHRSCDMYIDYENVFLYIIILFLYVLTVPVWFAAHRAWLLCAKRKNEHTFWVTGTSTCQKHQIQRFVFTWLMKLYYYSVFNKGEGGGVTWLKLFKFTAKTDVSCTVIT